MSDGASVRGRDLWLTAGHELMRSGGVRAIKVRSLADELGLTTGSFYHHFSGMQDFFDQLAVHFASGQRAALDAAEHTDPRRRLRLFVGREGCDRARSLDIAMRDWAMTNQAAAAAVRAHDADILEFLERAFLDMGHHTDGARLRAHLLHAVSIARLPSTWPMAPGLFDQILEVLSC